MNVLAILGAMEALCSFELVLEGKTGLLKKVSIADSLLLRILSNSPKVPRAKFLGRDELLRFSSIVKFCSLKNPFTKIT